MRDGCKSFCSSLAIDYIPSRLLYNITWNFTTTNVYICIIFCASEVHMHAIKSPFQ